MINFCWFFFKWGSIAGLLGAVVGIAYFYHQVGETIRARVEEKLAAGNTALKVTVRSAALVPGQGIVLHGVLFAEAVPTGPRPELLYLDEVRLACQTDIEDLLTKDPEPTDVVIRRPKLWATRRPDGSWSAAKLLPWPNYGENHPPVTIQEGSIEISDPLKTPAAALTLRDVNLTLATVAAANPSGASPGQRRLHGRLAGDHCRQIDVDGLIDLCQPKWNLHGQVEGLDLSASLIQSLPEPLYAMLDGLQSLRGEMSLGFAVSNAPSPAAPWQFRLDGRLLQGRLEDARLPYPLTDLQAVIRCDATGCVIDDFTGRCGPASFQIAIRQPGFDRGGPLHVAGEIRQLEFDEHLFAILPADLKQLWAEYQPSGRVAVTGHLDFDGRAWQPDLSARCENIAICYREFPYRLESGQGIVELKRNSALGQDLLRLDLKTQGANQPVKLTGEIIQPLGNASGWVQVQSNEMRLDEKLFKALPEDSRALVRALDPRGACDLFARWGRNRPDEPLHRHIKLDLHRCDLRYEKFPYALGNLGGTLEMHDGFWSIRNLDAANGASRIGCEGYLKPPEEGAELFLQLTGSAIPLEDDLRDALPPNLRRTWNDLHPHGTLDLVVEIRYRPGQDQLDIGVSAEPHNDTTWIEPACFPYRLEKLRGKAIYRNGKLVLERLRAEHGAVKLSGTGGCDFPPGGGWSLHLDDLSVDRLALDRDLIQALPNRLRRGLSDLSPKGAVNIHGALTFQGGARASDLIQSNWNLKVGFQRGSLDCGVPLENVSGELALAGDFDGSTFRSRGELDVDSLTYKDVQFTQLRGPLSIDEQRVLFGEWVDRPPTGALRTVAVSAGPTPRSITAAVGGGTLRSNGEIILDSHRYQMGASLNGADLGRCAREFGASHPNMRGKVTAVISLHGAGRSASALEGRGSVKLTEANIYELPLILNILKFLSLREPDSKGFSNSDIKFSISGRHVNFEPIDFHGDAISLFGKGYMDFDQQLQLTFNTAVGRADVQVPLLTPLLRGTSEQLMLIHVTGPLHDPQISREALPVVGNVLNLFQPHP